MILDYVYAYKDIGDLEFAMAQADAAAPNDPETQRLLADCFLISLRWDLVEDLMAFERERAAMRIAAA